MSGSAFRKRNDQNNRMKLCLTSSQRHFDQFSFEPFKTRPKTLKLSPTYVAQGIWKLPSRFARIKLKAKEMHQDREKLTAIVQVLGGVNVSSETN